MTRRPISTIEQNPRDRSASVSIKSCVHCLPASIIQSLSRLCKILNNTKQNMFRHASGGTSFSFHRLITNAIPNFANDNPSQDADLSLTEKDMLWTHQVQGAQAGGRSPMTLDTGSAMRAGVTSKLTPLSSYLLHTRHITYLLIQFPPSIREDFRSHL